MAVAPLVLLAVSLTPVTVASAVEPPHTAVSSYVLPVEASVRRGFEPPLDRYGSGHRGVDLDAAAGTLVRAAAAGVVSHAGPVADITWVSVSHPDGVVTSYGPMAAVRVRVGQRVAGGGVLGTTAAGGHGEGGADRGLHWSARRDGQYLDPLTLLHGTALRPSLVGAGSWRGVDHVVQPYEPWSGARAGGMLVGHSPVASAAGYAVPPSPNHLVLLQGLASTGSGTVLDPVHLGYELRSVTAFSYAGRWDGSDAADDPSRDQLPYGPEHTWAGVPDAAARLEEQLRAFARREPGRAVDLLGHSLGGVVALYYLTELHDPYDVGLPQIGSVVTVGAPLRGSDLASVSENVRRHGWLGPLLDVAQRGLASGDGPLAGTAGQLPIGAGAIAQLATGSALLDQLALGWDDALREGHAGSLATGTRVLTVAGARDLVVTADRARLPDLVGDPFERLDRPGSSERVARAAEARSTDVRRRDADDVSQHRVLPGDHRGVLETEALREAVWTFLAGGDVVDSPGTVTTIVGRELGQLAGDGAAVLRIADTMRAPVKALRSGSWKGLPSGLLGVCVSPDGDSASLTAPRTCP